MREWLSAHAVDCDADRHAATDPYTPILDPFCDGLSDIDEAIDVDGDDCDDVHERPPLDTVHPRHKTRVSVDQPCFSPALLDKDRNCKLDFDATGDLIVDAADFYAFGC